MTDASPLALPTTWDLVASAYAAEIVPMFEAYANDALDRIGVTAGSRIADVATGPGTLALLAARRGAQVDALDFSPAMLAGLEARLKSEGVTSVTMHQGDGMALPFADASYDAAFSMFGLFLFSDRERGFRELQRVLRPGARAAVTSWQPFDRAPMLAGLFATLSELMPNLPFGDHKAPLGDRDEFLTEMSAGGFHDVEVVELMHAFPMASTDDFFASLERTCAPLALLQQNMGAAWQGVRDPLLARMHERFGPGPHDVVMPALLGTGTR
jgi:ubiquinone/menaquinone biosynthesis C-methylase UbiE